MFPSHLPSLPAYTYFHFLKTHKQGATKTITSEVWTYFSCFILSCVLVGDVNYSMSSLYVIYYMWFRNSHFYVSRGAVKTKIIWWRKMELQKKQTKVDQCRISLFRYDSKIIDFQLVQVYHSEPSVIQNVWVFFFPVISKQWSKTRENQFWTER